MKTEKEIFCDVYSMKNALLKEEKAIEAVDVVILAAKTASEIVYFFEENGLTKENLAIVSDEAYKMEKGAVKILKVLSNWEKE